MRGCRSIASSFVAAALALSATRAHAQRPICAPLGAGETVQSVCAPFSLYPAIRFLADFTVDQLFKPAPPPIQRTLLEAGQLFAARQVIDNPPLETFLAALAPLRFSQFDRTTGTLVADFDENDREFEGRLAGVEGEPTLSLRVPAHLQGGYWRGPDVLQIAFWEHERIAVRLAADGGRAFDGEVECVALSPDGLLVRFAPQPRTALLLQFRECDQ